jgi:hypothetical protein
MASLEDTFRMMKGEEPVNTNRLTKTDKLNQEMKSKFNGNPSGKITRGFMDSVRSTLIETRGGTVVSESPAAAPVEEVKKYRDGLVSAGKVLVASLKAIDFEHEAKPHDLNNLINVENAMRQLSGHLAMFPELRKTIKGRVKFPAHPKRQQRSGP